MSKEFPKLEPRNQCEVYVFDKGIKPVLVTKREFNALCSKDAFVDGPYRDTFGDGPHDPYNPHRQSFGILRGGKVVFCELSDSLAGRVEEELNIQTQTK